MKNRRIILITFLLVTTLSIGIGYAAIQDTLMINGGGVVKAEAAAEALDADVYFSGAKAADNSNEVTFDKDKDEATFKVISLKGAGDTTTFTFTIENDGDLEVKVTPEITVTDTTDNTYFTVTTEWDETNGTVAAGGGTAEVTVTVKLNKTPVNGINMSATITLNAVAGA